MTPLYPRGFLPPLALLLACGGAAPDSEETPKDSGTVDSGDTAETGDTADSGGPAETGETGDTAVALDVELALDPYVNVMIHATWADPGATDAWVEYRLGTEEWSVAPAVSSTEAVILGIPANRRVEARVAAVVGGATVYSPAEFITTGALPAGLDEPTVVSFDESLASDTPYFMISIATGEGWYDGPYYLEIFDRAGHVVWYRRVTDLDGLVTLSGAVSRDGTHIWYESADIFGFAAKTGTVTRETLDGRWSEVWSTPQLGQAIAEGPDGSFFMERRDASTHGVDRLDASGAITPVWDCGPYFEELGLDPSLCLLNTVNWSEATNTVLASQFETGTVFEIDVATGAIVRQMGALPVGDPYTFDPPESTFAYQHYPHWTADGTLLVSTHHPCDGTEAEGCDPMMGRADLQIAAEYTVDDATHTLTRIWSYESTDPWAYQAGEAWRLDNGNLIQGFGQNGTLEEITPEGTVAWRVEWPLSVGGYRLLGHTSPVPDLYALNRGP